MKEMFEKEVELKLKIMKRDLILEVLCTIINIIAIISFTILAIIFKKWWIVLFATFFFRCTTKSLEEMK